ncbi:MAG: hypothetical protein NT129_04805 [Candidatus Aenigmarchaeota archaeon]|nr:hypothetical protein [Candidatus Aenigmarchaeota archaeon]
MKRLNGIYFTEVNPDDASTLLLILGFKRVGAGSIFRIQEDGYVVLGSPSNALIPVTYNLPSKVVPGLMREITPYAIKEDDLTRIDFLAALYSQPCFQKDYNDNSSKG